MYTECEEAVTKEAQQSLSTTSKPLYDATLAAVRCWTAADPQHLRDKGLWDIHQ
jgi:hypothetical protein